MVGARMTRPIPRREPELVKAEADRHHGGVADKVATTTIRGVRFNGALLHSTGRKADELEAMMGMIGSLPVPLASAIASVICDSGSGCHLTVYVKDWTKAQAIADRLGAAPNPGIDVRHDRSPGLKITVEPN
jgi:hypothetical protein